jgi:ketosteroid isomerase-like protein
VVQYFTADVLSMSPQGNTPVRGREANRAAWARFFRGTNPVHTMTTDTVVVAARGDLGYTWGQWTVAVGPPNGRAQASGYYVAVWRHEAAGWRIAVVSAYPFRQ